MKAQEYFNKINSERLAMRKPKPKKRGRKPGVKVGPYKKTKLKNINNDGLENLVNELEAAIKTRIKYLNTLLKRIK